VTQIPAGQATTAILDGQQRLTALNIGLYGSHAERQPRKWWSNPDAFPKKRLYLNLGSKSFPVAEIEQAMASIGKSIKFEAAEINELLDVRYGSQRVFPVLTTLYPGLDMTKAFHEDHIFPRSRFTRTKLLKEGMAEDPVEEHLAKVDALPSLQLLPGLPNIEKQATLPAAWLKAGAQANRTGSGGLNRSHPSPLVATT
jgi:hypothetical protein